MVCLLQVGLGDGPDSAEMDENGGTPANQFGTYTIVHHEDGGLWELGRGAMGVTFRAMDTTLNRAVALKIIHTGIAAGTQARERFMRGARVAAALRHPNVATIYHFGIHEETGQFFYAMELVEGETLEERVLRTGPLDTKTTIAIAQQVASALVEAEKRGLVHRDLKPANLMLVSPNEGTLARHGDESGTLRVKIIDFGLAKAIGAHGDPMSLTQGGFVGTPAFASPEQFGNETLDIRSDIYSLGVTLWYALTGRTPFQGRSIDEIRNAQGSTGVPIEQLEAARVPSRLQSLLQSMVAFQPAARPDVYGLLVGLRRSRLPGTRRLALGTALLLVALGLASFLLWPSRGDFPRLRTKAPINAAGTSNQQAQEAYLKGQFLLAKRESPACKQAIKFFEKAIALDPNYAMAYSGLAETYPLIANDDPLIARSEDYAKATAAANRAIELDATLPNPHAALGLIAMNYEYDWATAEKEYKRAIALNPNYPTAHHWYAEYLITQDRSDESLAEIKRAHELDPRSIIIMSDTGKILFYARRYDEAIDVLRKTREMDPNFPQLHAWLAQIYYEKGMFDEAILESRASQGTDRLDGGNVAARFPYMTAMIGRTLAKAGRRAEAEKAFGELQQLRKRHELEPIVLLPIYLALGEKDEIFDLLEKEYDVRSAGLTSLKVNPLYDSVRSDPRFTELMRRVGLAPPDSSASRSLGPETD
jgi:serine/threonine protein kinase/Flp pilus assembly protein TadD